MERLNIEISEREKKNLKILETEAVVLSGLICNLNCTGVFYIKIVKDHIDKGEKTVDEKKSINTPVS